MTNTTKQNLVAIPLRVIFWAMFALQAAFILYIWLSGQSIFPVNIQEESTSVKIQTLIVISSPLMYPIIGASLFPIKWGRRNRGGM